jgi:hypothetical protein
VRRGASVPPKDILLNSDNIPADGIIGNTVYRYIADKKYIKTDTKYAIDFANKLNDERIPFSGRINGNSTTFTVSGEALKTNCLKILDEIINSYTQAEVKLQYINKNKDDDNKYAGMVTDFLNNKLKSSDLIKLGSTPLHCKLGELPIRKWLLRKQHFKIALILKILDFMGIHRDIIFH